MEIKTFDLTRILGIFLDNAIEASSISKEKQEQSLKLEENVKTLDQTMYLPQIIMLILAFVLGV